MDEDDDPIELLLDELLGDGAPWPPREQRTIRETILTRRAFGETDREALRLIAGWPKDRNYKVDSLGELIRTAWADYLFGEDVRVTPAATGDVAPMTELLDSLGDLTSVLHEAAGDVVSEGERWWRITVDPLLDHPGLEWHGRDVVYPYFLGSRLLACALVTRLKRRKGDRTAVYRHMELHADGVVQHRLFKGTKQRLGTEVDLEDHPEVAPLAAAVDEDGRWEHELDGMLMGRVTNGSRVDRELNLGVSDFDRIEDQLLDLNEAATIAAENARLTAKRRVVVPESSVDDTPQDSLMGDLVDNGDGSFRRAPRPTFDAGEDVYVATKLDAELGRGAEAPFKVLEYSFDAASLIAYKRDVTETALTRVSITPQYVGVVTGEGDGLSLSGTALRLRLIPTTKGGKGKGKQWDRATPTMVLRLAQVDALEESQGGFGHAWGDVEKAPSIERGDNLPHDEVEDATIETTLVSGGVRSVRLSITEQHPDWTPEQITEELGFIREDEAARAPAPFAG